MVYRSEALASALLRRRSELMAGELGLGTGVAVSGEEREKSCVKAGRRKKGRREGEKREWQHVFSKRGKSEQHGQEKKRLPLEGGNDDPLPTPTPQKLSDVRSQAKYLFERAYRNETLLIFRYQSFEWCVDCCWSRPARHTSPIRGIEEEEML